MIVLGLAGRLDHGKTALVLALVKKVLRFHVKGDRIGTSLSFGT